MQTDDLTLTQDGLAPEGSGKLLVLACGALAREIIALTGHMPHIDLQCLPAILHNHPERITQAVEDAVEHHKDHYETIFVAYADCGTGGQLQTACNRLGVEMIKGPHCYSFFEGNAAFAARDEIDAFYLTDFLARQFDAFVTKPLGLDTHPELTEIYFGNYRKLIYLAQTQDPELVEKAKACAAKLNLSYDYRFTGYGDLETTLTTFFGP